MDENNSRNNPKLSVRVTTRGADSLNKTSPPLMAPSLRLALAIAAGAATLAYWIRRRRRLHDTQLRTVRLIEGAMVLLASGDADAAVEAFDAVLDLSLIHI